MKRILVLTGARSEFGILEPVFRALDGTPGIEPRLVATGVHFLSDYGDTAGEIEKVGLEIAARVPFYDEASLSEAALPAALARGVEGIGRVVGELESDMIVVLGDRAEAMAGALAGYAAGIAVAHLHGGEKTDSGHLDEGFRHAITRLAHLHFAATETAADRLIAMGEEPWRVHRVGAPGVDNVRAFVDSWRRDPVGREREFRERLALPSEGPVAVLLLHPDRLTRDDAGPTARQILSALLEREVGVLAIHPNSDPGSDEIIAAIEDAVARAPGRVCSHASLATADFHAALASSACLVGNSSAGIIEAPLFGIPVVNVGERNRDREHGPGVTFVGGPPGAGLAAALDRALEANAGETRAGGGAIRPPYPSPYGDGQACPRIADVISRAELGPALLGKRLLL